MNTVEKKLEHTLFSKCITELNKLFNNEKTSSLAVSILFKLKPRVICVQTDAINSLSVACKIEDFAPNLFLNFNKDGLDVVFFYNSEVDKTKLPNITNKNYKYLTFLLIVEVIKILNKWNTVAHRSTLLSEYRKYSNYQSLIDLRIQNDAIQFLKKIYETVSENYLYVTFAKAATPDTDNLEFVEITENTINSFYKQLKIVQEDYPSIYTVVKNYQEVDEIGYTTPSDEDIVISNLAQLLEQDISTNCKGNAVGVLFNVLFESKKIDIDWFGKIQRNISNVIYTETGKGTRSWINISKTMRHVAIIPASYKNQKKLDLIISIDQSGSVHTEQLMKILNIFEENIKHIKSVRVLIHTTSVIKEIEETFTDIGVFSDKFKNCFAIRYGHGGTSHADVFKHIDALDFNPETAIYLSFSDNCSDIEDVFFNYSNTSKIKNIYWISEDGNRDVDTNKVFGTNFKIPSL